MARSVSHPKTSHASAAAVAHNETIHEVLTAIRLELSHDPTKTKKQICKQMGDFVTVANHISRSLMTPRDQLTVVQVIENEETFFDYVAKCHLSPKSKAKLLDRRKALLRYARKFGFSRESFALINEWEASTRGVDLNHGLLTIVQDAIRRGRRPIDFSQDDLTVWADARLSEGRTYSYTRDAQRLLLTRIQRAELQHMFPLLNTAPRCPSYKLRINLMPQSLREEILGIVSTRRTTTGIRRPSLTSTADQWIIMYFEALVGYAVTLRGIVDLTSIRPLLNEAFIFEYALFLRTVRGCKRTTVVAYFSTIFSALSRASAFRDCDLSWIDSVYRKLRREPESALKARRRKRYVPFQDLALVPDKMRRDRLALVDPSPWTLAWSITDELLLSCLILAQWPSRFLRLAEVGRHIFKGAIPKDGPPLAIPAWAKEQLSQDPGTEFWQFHFEDLQGELHRGLVLRQIVPLLELYLKEYRPLLADPDHPKLLFWNKSGLPLSPSNLGNRVSGVVWRYIKKRASPTSIRSSFAYYWRDKYPNKDAVLAKIQWIDYPTIKMRYDEEYRKQRAARVQRCKGRYS
jgi:hypothetical protein